MSLENENNSVGTVSAEKILIDKPLKLACGVVLPSHELMVETYGTLNADKSNAILICHALSGSHHAAGYYEGDEKPGWWDNYIGPGKPMDSNRFFIVSLNNIGSCFGSTGPASINPETGEIWGADFPALRARDWVESQRLLMEHLGIDCWAAVMGQPWRHAGYALGAGASRKTGQQYCDRLLHEAERTEYCL